MSFDVALEYLNKAKEYLNASRLLFSNSSYNASSLASEVSAQLAIKALLIKLGIEVPRTHEIRKLLSIIYDKLKIDEVMIFMRENRKDLIILENIKENHSTEFLQFLKTRLK